MRSSTTKQAQAQRTQREKRDSITSFDTANLEPWRNVFQLRLSLVEEKTCCLTERRQVKQLGNNICSIRGSLKVVKQSTWLTKISGMMSTTLARPNTVFFCLRKNHWISWHWLKIFPLFLEIVDISQNCHADITSDSLVGPAESFESLRSTVESSKSRKQCDVVSHLSTSSQGAGWFFFLLLAQVCWLASRFRSSAFSDNFWNESSILVTCDRSPCWEHGWMRNQ